MTTRDVLARTIGQEAPITGPLGLSIGGVGLSLEWQEPRSVGWTHAWYKPFIAEANETIRFHIGFDDCPKLSEETLMFDGEPHWKLYRDDPGYLIEVFAPPTRARNMVARVDDEFREAEVTVVPATSPGAWPSWSVPRLMNPLGQWLLVHRLAALEGVIVHALVVDDRGRGRVFVGPSGAGKSTLAGFWRRRSGVRILGDEMVILKRLEGRFYAFGTPWPGLGGTVSGDPVEIREIFFIEHDSEHRVREGSDGQFASRLFSQLFLPHWNHRIVLSGLAMCQALVENVVCRTLGFTKHPSVIDFVRQVEPQEPTTEGR